MSVRVRYLGGPTALIEIGGVRLLTDPTFDPAGEYPIGSRALTKTLDAVAAPEDLGTIDAVLLSHDQHPDNLDHGGRAFLGAVPLVLTTALAAQRLGAPAAGLEPGQRHTIGEVVVTGLPARHGPPGCESATGPVIGFLLEPAQGPRVYVSGDNAGLDVVGEIAEEYAPVDVAVLFAGGARTALLDSAYLTLTSEQAAEAARLLSAHHVVPLHFEGWAHFSQGRDTMAPAFAAAALAERLHLLDPGETVELTAG